MQLKSFLGWANVLSLLRLFAAAPFLALLQRSTQPEDGRMFAAGAAALFVLAALSDVFDGVIARRLRQTSRVGAALDHWADFVFVMTCLIYFVHTGSAPLWLPLLVALFFLQFTIDSYWIGKPEGEKAYISNRLGKLAGISYYLAVGAIAANMLLGEPPLASRLLLYLLAAIGTFTVFASITRLLFARRLYRLRRGGLPS